MSQKWLFFAAHRFYTAEEALTILTNMRDFKDECTSESENEGDSSDSSASICTRTTSGTHRTDSNILMPKETKVSKANEIPKNGPKSCTKTG